MQTKQIVIHICGDKAVQFLVHCSHNETRNVAGPLVPPAASELYLAHKREQQRCARNSEK